VVSCTVWRTLPVSYEMHMNRLNTRPDIVAIKVILEDGTEVAVSERQLGSGKPSQCIWIGEYFDGDFRISLRLDWKDLDRKGNPTLDADIWHKGTEYFVDSKKWHQTIKTKDTGEWVYIFSFGTVRVRFKVQITSQRTTSARARIVAAPASCNDEGPSREAEELLQRLLGEND
jgi:hypothetical protein